MKKIINSLWDFMFAIGRARYAAHLARSGRYDEARKIYERA